MLRKEFCEANIFSPRNGGCFPGDIRVTKICPPLPLKKKHGTFPFQVIFKKNLLNSKLHTLKQQKKVVEECPCDFYHLCFFLGGETVSPVDDSLNYHWFGDNYCITRVTRVDDLKSPSVSNSSTRVIFKLRLLFRLGGSHGLHLVALQNQGQILGFFVSTLKKGVPTYQTKQEKNRNQANIPKN